MKRFLATLALVAVALSAAACARTNADAGTPAASLDPSAPSVVARGMAFKTPTINVAAGKAFQLSFDNEDGAPHNVAIYTDSSAGTNVFRGDIVSGPTTTVYAVPALAAGTYFFRCDVHPDMTGTIVAG